MIQRTWWPRINPNAQLAKGLLFAGLGGGASTLQCADASGYSNHGTLTAMDPAGDWLFDSTLNRWCLDFAGTDDYVDIGGARALATIPPFTLGAWVNLPAASTNYGILSLGHASTSNHYHYITSQAGKVWANSRGTEGSFYSESSGSLSNNVWAHVVGVFASTALRTVYLNGVKATPNTNTVNVSVSRTWLGALNRSAPTLWLVGKAADPMIWDRALSDAEVQQLADPSNVLLSGLILPPRRVMFPAAVAGGIPEGYASLSAVADIAAVGYAERSGSAPLGAVASLAAVGYRGSVGTAELVVVASVDAVGYAESAAAASLDAVASISATGYATHSGATELAAIGGIAAAGYAAAHGFAELSAVADIEAVGESPSAIPDGYAALTAGADLAAVGYAEHSGSAETQAVASLEAAGYAEASGYAALEAVASLAVVGEAPAVATAEGYANLSAIAEMAVVGYVAADGFAELSAVADIAAVGVSFIPVDSWIVEALQAHVPGIMAGQVHIPGAEALDGHGQ